MSGEGWVLNLDADRELADPVRFGRRGKEVARIETILPRLAALVGEGRVLRETDAPGSATGRVGRCWCPTPFALSLLSQLGAELPAAPGVDVLRRVNHRAFCHGLGAALPGAAFLEDLDAVVALVGEPTPGGSWLLKRPFSFAGAGRLPIFVGRVTDGERRWMQQALAQGGLMVEPLVERLGDYSMHGELAPDGALRVGRLVSQRITEGGQWQSSAPSAPGDASEQERRALREEVERVAAALREAGYFGPFGVDAFRYRWGDEVRFNVRCEINARYTMSWSAGMS